MIKLVSVYPVTPYKLEIMWDLMREATPDQSISHKNMPLWEEHVAYVDSHPHPLWDFIKVGEDYVGTIYISKRGEIGIRIFNVFQHKGYGTEALKMIRKHYPGKLYANINPNNQISIDCFTKLGAKLIQYTYEIPREQT